MTSEQTDEELDIETDLITESSDDNGSDDNGSDDESNNLDPLLCKTTTAHMGQRLDVFVTASLPNCTRSEAQRLIELRTQPPVGVRVNGKPEKPNYRLRAGDTVAIARPVPVTTHIEPESIPLSIVYEDTDMLVIDKPRGMVVHPAPGSETGTLVNAVLGYATDLSGIGGEQRPGIVHRLDKDTGGLIMVAKNDIAHRSLQAQIQARTASRRYLALVWDVPTWERATVDAPIGRHPSDRKKMAVLTDPHHTSRHAETMLTKQETFLETFALIEARLQTGRTHQIRVHCSYIRHPIVGDPLYGGLRKLPSSAGSTSARAHIEVAIAELDGQALHAYALSVDQPRTGERLHFEVPLPTPMQKLLDLLRNTNGR